MAARTFTNGKSGEIELEGGYVFRWMLQGERPPEIYGWVEFDHAISKQGGFWRTPDPEEACKRACAAFELMRKED